MATKTFQARVTTTGADGSAVGTAIITGAAGLLVRRQIKPHASAPNTTDIDIDMADDFGTLKLFDRDNSVAAVDDQPQKAVVGVDGVALDPAVYMPIVLSGAPITVTVAGCNALTNAVIVKLTVLD